MVSLERYVLHGAVADAVHGVQARLIAGAQIDRRSLVVERRRLRIFVLDCSAHRALRVVLTRAMIITLPTKQVTVNITRKKRSMTSATNFQSSIARMRA